MLQDHDAYRQLTPHVQDGGDILDRPGLDKALRGVEAVYHLAAKVSDWGPLDGFIRLNLQGTYNVLRSAEQAGCRQFVHMSSLAIHGWRDHVDADENEPKDVPANYPYGLTKRLAEDMALREGRAGRISVTVIRPGFFPFGPRDRTSFFPLAEHLAKGQFAFVDGGRKLTCVSYVESLAQGMALTCLNPASYGEIFILADDPKITWKDVMTRICSGLGVAVPRISVPFAAIYPLVWVMDKASLLLGKKEPPTLTRYRLRINHNDFHFVSHKAKKILGYDPKISMEDGIERTVRWYHGVR